MENCVLQIILSSTFAVHNFVTLIANLLRTFAGLCWFWQEHGATITVQDSQQRLLNNKTQNETHGFYLGFMFLGRLAAGPTDAVCAPLANNNTPAAVAADAIVLVKS